MITMTQQSSFGLTSEDESSKQFPWRQVMGAMKRICPTMGLPEKADRRDAVMRNFWKKRGRTVGCFEVLARRVQESDYLMARNGHTGKDGHAVSWSFIFSKNAKGVLRCDAIMDDNAYSNETMAFLIENKPKSVVKTRVILAGVQEPQMVDLTELHYGKPRYVSMNSEMGGFPNYLDRKD
jgi:hypothetical protein